MVKVHEMMKQIIELKKVGTNTLYFNVNDKMHIEVTIFEEQEDLDWLIQLIERDTNQVLESVVKKDYEGDIQSALGYIQGYALDIMSQKIKMNVSHRLRKEMDDLQSNITKMNEAITMKEIALLYYRANQNLMEIYEQNIERVVNAKECDEEDYLA